MDALTHAIEACLSVRATALSDVLALSAIAKVGQSLRAAFKNGQDLAARMLMRIASLEAGMVFSNAVLLPHVMAWSMSEAGGRFADIARALGVDTAGLTEKRAAERAVAEVRALCQDLQIPGLTGLGIDPDTLMALAPTMAKDALASGSPGNNPRLPTVEEIVDLYRKAL